MPKFTAKLSLTETRHFKRLVSFLEDVEAHADDQCDMALKELVEECRSDLLRLHDD